MYLVKRNADREAVDIYGNTPLGVALLNNHHNFCIIMIQNASNVNKLVHPIDPEKINKMWKKEKDDQDAEMKEESDDDQNKKHRKVFDKMNSDPFGYGSEYDSENDNSSEDSDSDDSFEKNAFNN